jgi:hypothetical protein
MAIGVDPINEDGTMLTAMPGQVSLTVTVDIYPAAPSAGLVLAPSEQRCGFLSLPYDIARQS